MTTEVWCSREIVLGSGTTDYGKLKKVLEIIEPLAKSRKYGGDGPYVRFDENNYKVEIKWLEHREDI